MMKFILTRLHSTIRQERLENLMFLSYKRDFKINYEEAITQLKRPSDVLKKYY